MKILVAVKRVLDPYLKPRLLEEKVDLSGMKMAINPFDEIAIEEALKLKEAGKVNEVVAVSIGETNVVEQLRTALALGVDRAVHVDAEAENSSLAIAKIIKAVVDKEDAQMVIVGKQAVDSDNNQTGQMLAALMGAGQATNAYKLELSESAVQVTKEVDGGLKTIKLTLPAVITTDLRLNEPRYANIRNIMMAKRKPLETLSLSDLNLEQQVQDANCQVQVESVEMPPTREQGIVVESVEELVEKMKNEAKVIS